MKKSIIALALLASVISLGAMEEEVLDLSIETDPQELIKAAREGENALVKDILDEGIDCKTADRNGNTALHWAAKKGNKALVEFLLKYAETHDIKGKTQSASHPNNLKKTNTQIAQQMSSKARSKMNLAHDDPWAFFISGVCKVAVDLWVIPEEDKEKVTATRKFIDFRNRQRMTALHWAILKGHDEIAELLIKKGAEIHICAVERIIYGQGCSGRPLHVACATGNLNIVTLLIKMGAEISATDEHKRTPLHYAAESGSQKIVDLLIEEGANIDAVDDKDKTAPEYAAANGHYKVAANFLLHADEINGQTAKGFTALHFAARGGDEKFALELIGQGARVDIQDNRGWTALHYAAHFGHRDLVTALSKRSNLLKSRIGIFAANISVLCVAAKAGHMDIVEDLIGLGVNINGSIEGMGSCTYMQWALIQRNIPLIELLQKKGVEITNDMLLILTQWNELEIARQAMFNGAYPIKKDKNGAVALHYAAKNGNTELCESILQTVLAHELFRICGKHYDRVFSVICSFAGKDSGVGAQIKQKIPKDMIYYILRSCDDLCWSVIAGACKNGLKDKGDLVQTLKKCLIRNVYKIVPKQKVIDLLAENLGDMLVLHCKIKGTGGEFFQNTASDVAGHNNHQALKDYLDPDTLKQRLPKLLEKWLLEDTKFAF